MRGRIAVPVTVAVAMAAALSVMGCAARMAVSSHVSRGVDFAPYRTFAWGPADALPTGDPRLDRNPQFKDDLQGAVERGLAARGLRLSTTGTPDLLLHYHASVTRRLDVSAADVPRGYCYGDDCRAWVSEYDAGTIVLDVVDTRTNQVIWRGWARTDLADVLESPERMRSRIEQAVTRMLERLPRALVAEEVTS